MRLRTLGGLELEGTSFGRMKPLLLLCYLALEGPKERRHLAELFWMAAANPLGSLSMALTQLRQTAPGSFDADKVRVWTKVETDAGQLLAALERGELEQALALYRGRFLDGVYLQDWGVELEEWVYHTREFLAGRVRGVLLRLAEVEASKGQLERAAKRADQAYLLLGAPEPEPEEMERLYTLMLAGGSLQAAEVRKEAASFGITLTSSPQRAKEQLHDTLDAIDSPTSHNLPTRSTSFVGRDLELTEVITLLGKPDCRLVTVIGPGGVGKTRLALQVAGELLQQGQFKEGIYFIPLEAVMAPSFIPSAIASTLGLVLQAQDEPHTQVVRAIGDRQLLLIMDNFEHLIEGATFASELLASCHNLKLLVTSRERLNLEEEWIFPLEGLAYRQHDSVAWKHSQYIDAVQLFVQRAKRARPGFILDDTNLPAILKICRLVEGLPLGIELAATWIKIMPAEVISQEIERTLDFLATPTRNIPERHKSIQAAFEHSWELLSAREQDVLQKLSVFRGGFRREAAAEVAGASIPILAALVDKSLLRVSHSERYDLHPLLRQYTQEKLAKHPEVLHQAQLRHAQYYLVLAERAELHLTGSQQEVWLERLEEEHENLRAVQRRAVKTEDVAMGLRLAGALWRFWLIRGYLREGREQLSTVLVQDKAKKRRAVRAKALHGAGALAYAQGDYAAARSLSEESLIIWQELGDKRSIALLLNNLGTIAYQQGNYISAQLLHEQSLALRRELDDKWGIASSLSNLANVSYQQGNYTLAQVLYEESLLIERELGDKEGIAFVLGNLGAAATAQGAYASARSLLEESLAIRRELGDRWGIALSLGNLGDVASAEGDDAAARALYEESLIIRQELGDKWGIAYSLEGLARLAARHQNPERAAYLWGAAESIRQAIGTPLLPHERARYEHDLVAARSQMDEAAFTAAWAKGRDMSLDEAITYAVEKMAEETKVRLMLQLGAYSDDSDRCF